MLRMRDPLRKAIFMGLVGLPAAFVSCRTEERAPRVRVTGVDRPASMRAANPYDTEAERDEEREKEEAEPPPAPGEGPTSLRIRTPPAPGARTAAPGTAVSEPRAELLRLLGPDSFLEPFVARLRESGTEGPVAVFPALTRVRGGEARALDRPDLLVAWRTSELGDRLSEEIIRRLSRAGSPLRPYSFLELKALIEASNRSLANLDEPESAVGLATRLPLAAVVYGEIELVRPERGPDAFLRVRYRATSIPELKGLADARRIFVPNRIGRVIFEECERPGQWRIGAQAPPYRPSLEREIEWMAANFFPRLIERVPGGVAGARWLVTPAITGAVERAAGDLVALDEAFASEWRSRAGDRSSEAIRKALDAGPVRLLGQEYATLGAAQAAAEKRRAALRAGDAWSMSAGVARVLADRLAHALPEGAQVRTLDGWAVPPRPAAEGKPGRTIVVRTRVGAAIEIPKLAIELVDPDAHKLLASLSAEFDPLVVEAARQAFAPRTK